MRGRAGERGGRRTNPRVPPTHPSPRMPTRPPPCHVARGVTAVLAIAPIPAAHRADRRRPPHQPRHPSIGTGCAARFLGVSNSSGCKGSLRAFAPRTQAAARAARPGPNVSARRADRRRPPPSASRCRHRPGSPDPRGVWDRCAILPPPLRAWAAKSGPRARRGEPTHQARPSARPPNSTGAKPVHRHRATLQGVSSQSPQLHQTRPSVRTPPHRRRQTRPSPPCHVARGVIAVPAIAPNPSVGPPTPASPAPTPPTTTVPRSMGWHRVPRHCTSPAHRPAHPRTAGAKLAHRHRATLQGVSPQFPQLHQPRSSARPPPGTTGAKPAHRHRATLQGVSPQFPQLHQPRPSARPPPHHRRQTRPPPPCHVARGVTAGPRNCTKPARRPTAPPAPTPAHHHRPTFHGVAPRASPLHQTRPSARPHPNHRCRATSEPGPVATLKTGPPPLQRTCVVERW